MITFSAEPRRKISQEAYRADIDRLPLKKMRCSRCGCTGRLTRHACYTREIKTVGNQVSLTVSRLKCGKCNHTHAIVPSYVVPYCQVTLWEQVQILCQFMWGHGISTVMERNSAIDENLSYSILRRYRKHWQKRFPAEDISLVPEEEVSRFCFSSFDKQFMQVRDIPNDFFAEPT